LSTLGGPLTIIIFSLTSVQGKYSLEVRSLICLVPSFLTDSYYDNSKKKNELHLRSNAALEALNVDKGL